MQCNSWRIWSMLKIDFLVKSLIFILLWKNASALQEEGGFPIDFDTFDEFKSYINKSYAHTYDEYRSRLAFEENRDAIREHNNRFKSGESSFRLRPNVMADMSNDSYLKAFLRLLRSKRFDAIDLGSEIVGSPLMRQTPAAIDWRQKGFITPPDNQKSCGSCYAFSIAESIEGQVFKRTGHILDLSPQQIVDCSVTFGNQGCTGGSLRNTLKYLQVTGGMMRAKDYKYVSKKGRCQFVKELAVVNVTSWAILPPKDEQAIEAAVAHIGPVAVSINATPKTFQLYSDGIYDDNSCTSASVNHAMLVVGYGKDYWILKNWWSEMWGENGYMRLRKGKNLCGIANYAAYSVV